MATVSQKLPKIEEIIKRSILTKDGNPVQYHLQTKTDNLDESKSFRKMTFGERDEKKPHKTILMVGETGTGKTSLINVMINYMLGVKREDKVWFEITDDQSDRTQAHSQTSIITVYEFYLQESPIHLTIIDTPGFANTEIINIEKEIVMGLLTLLIPAEDQKIDAVCLVIKSTQNRFFDKLVKINDAVQSLFGKDISENIVLLFTHSDGRSPRNLLRAVKEAKIKCAVNEKNRPVYFLFNNCLSNTDDEENDDDDDDDDDDECEKGLEQSWNISFKGMTKLFKFLDTINPKSMQMTRNVLKKQKQFCKIFNLISRVRIIELKQNELKQTQKALDQNKQYVKDFEYEVDVPYKERNSISPEAVKAVMCCTVCEENCVYTDSESEIRDLSWCSVMKDDHCTVCTKRCHYNKHVKEATIYEIKTKKEKRTYEDLKKKYDEKNGYNESVIKKLEEELKELEKEELKRVFDTFYCFDILEKITLNTDSLLTQDIDYLIRKLKEMNELEKAEILENIEKKAGTE